MLNISENSILQKFDTKNVVSINRNELPRANRMFAIWLIILLVIVLVIFFLPWTQNIQMKGKVTTLLPEQRPQDVNSVIAGRIEEWFVKEGDLVMAGDTIAFLSEVKAEYFDPQLLKRTESQIIAKKNKVGSYKQKANAIENQVEALRQELIFKKRLLENKILQEQLKQQSQIATVDQATMDAEIAAFQYRRTDTLFQKGIKSLSDLEGKQLKQQKTNAYLITAKNKLQETQNEVNNAKIALQSIDAEYNNKISKAESDRFTTLSSFYEAKGGVDKLQNQYNNYELRNAMYYVIAPQSGYITKTIKSGIGEMIKEGDKIVTIVPYERELAVELYVRPMDLPLINKGQEVRLVFDGWQAFIISGWADFSFGTYSGEVVAVDNLPNDNSLYRILVKTKNDDISFPELLRIGTGVQGIAILKDVPVWYEVWRQLNGFPADFYEDGMEKNKATFKPPVKSVAK